MRLLQNGIFVELIDIVVAIVHVEVDMAHAKDEDAKHE